MAINNVTLRYLERAYQEFYAEYGIGQFSYCRFAQWLLDNKPDTTVNLLEQQLRQIDRPQKGTHGSE